MPIVLGYHDVVEEASTARPIAPGHTTLYTLDRRQLRAHLEALRGRVGDRAVGRLSATGGGARVALTFDDGAAGAYRCAAEELERAGWRGHFFIVTDWIGKPGFLDAAQIRDLYRRGHVIGSHSRSHPLDMTALPFEELVREWAESRAILCDLVGAPVALASLPNGHYCRRIAGAAAQAGVELLLTSRPTASSRRVNGCLVAGRYSVRRSTPAARGAALAAGDLPPRLGQAVAWASKQTLRRLAGSGYERFRQYWWSWRRAREGRI